MIKVGITGGIGSGKSTVCRIFEILNIPIYYADIRAKKLMIESPSLVKDVKDLLGSQSYEKDGTLNRKFVAGKVFKDAGLLRQLNELVHPRVWADADNWYKSQDIATPYILNEAALLFETGSYKNFDKIILVTAPEEVRIERVMTRDSSTRKEVENRINKQLKDHIKIPLSDFEIKNDNKIRLIPQVFKIHNELMRCLKNR